MEKRAERSQMHGGYRRQKFFWLFYPDNNHKNKSGTELELPGLIEEGDHNRFPEWLRLKPAILITADQLPQTMFTSSYLYVGEPACQMAGISSGPRQNAENKAEIQALKEALARLEAWMGK